MQVTTTRRRNALSIAIMTTLLALVLALTGCATGQGASSDSSDASGSADSSKAKLAIIHTNDIHGYCQSSDTSLGIAAVAQLKEDYLEEGYEVMLLDAGDAFQGNLLIDESRGQSATEFMNACGYDAMALGNHEFDYGADVLQTLIGECNFPVLCANIYIDETGEPFTIEHAVFTLESGLKVGVFGIDTPETMTKSDPRDTEGLTIAQGAELYKCAQAQVDLLREDECELIVCLGHLGENGSSEPYRASDLVAETEGIDLFIDGHDHQVENTVMPDKAGNDVLVVETGCYLANIGVVTYEDGQLAETLVAVGDYDGKEPVVAELVDTVESDIDAVMSKKIGTTAFAMNGDAYPGNRDRETNLGDFMADAFRWEAKQALGDEPDCAIANGGGIRAPLAQGDITLRNIHDVSPYANRVCTIEVTGAQLLEALESACQGLPDSMGAFPQVSGITYTIDLSVPYEKGDLYPYSTYYAPANPGARVTVSDVNGKGFDLNATYVVAMSDFMAHGGDTYYCFAEAAQKTFQSTGFTPYQAMQYYLEDECGGVMPDEYAEPQGRVQVLGRDE